MTCTLDAGLGELALSLPACASGCLVSGLGSRLPCSALTRSRGEAEGCRVAEWAPRFKMSVDKKGLLAPGMTEDWARLG